MRTIRTLATMRGATDYPVQNDVPGGGNWRNPTDTGTPVAGSPCAQARTDADTHCAEAQRLAETADSERDRLRDARRRQAELHARRESDARMRDRRRLAEEKATAQADYHAALLRATDQAATEAAAAAWLHRIDELNRGARDSAARAQRLEAEISELERILPGLELAADGARISAEAAEAACMDARRALAACEERSSMSPVEGGFTTARSEVANAPVKAIVDRAAVLRAAGMLMRGNRESLLGVALRLADETGLEAGRLQLLLLELREQINARALEDYAFAFPDAHPFWSQFPTDGARNIAESLSSLGFRFDGSSGWADGRIPGVRDLAMALSYCGYDPRSLRRPAGQAAVDALWDGATVRGEDYLQARAPNMELSEIVGLLGARSRRLGELWDIWGRLRPLLLRAP